jgi:hypothetical protein
MRKVTETCEPVNPTTGKEVRESLNDSDGDLQMEDGDIPYDYYPPQLHAEIPLIPSSPEPERVDRRARVEEVEDEEAGDQSRWIEDYPEPAGSPGKHVQSYFEEVRAKQRENGEEPWAPFADQEEWELAQWLIMNVGQNATDKFL